MLFSLLQSEKKVGERQLSGQRSSQHETMEDHRGLSSVQLVAAKLYFGEQLIIQHNGCFQQPLPFTPGAFLFQVVLVKNIYKNSREKHIFQKHKIKLKYKQTRSEVRANSSEMQQAWLVFSVGSLDLVLQSRWKGVMTLIRNIQTLKEDLTPVGSPDSELCINLRTNESSEP